MLPVPGIPGIVPVVAHDEIAAFGHGVRPEAALHGVLDSDVLQRLIRPIEINVSIADFHSLSGKPDDPFDKELALIIRISEDDDIEAIRVAESIGQAVAEYPVACHDRVFHRTGWDLGIYDNK